MSRTALRHAAKSIALLAATFGLLGCGSAAPELPTPPPPSAATPATTTLGASKATAVEVCMPRGQRDYLARLRCSNGEAPSFDRAGSTGMRTPLPEPLAGESKEAHAKRALLEMETGDKDYHIVDLYRVRCGAESHAVYMDMYHCKAAAPTGAPAGFSIVPP